MKTIVGGHANTYRITWLTPAKFFRCIFAGSNYTWRWNGAGPGNKGELNLAPVGLGSLLTSGYIGDAQSFFCPSAEGMPSDDHGTGWDYDPAPAATTKAELQRAGGFDAESLTHGYWAWLSSFGWTSSSYYNYGGFSRGVLSNYNYRLVPSEVDDQDYSAGDRVHMAAPDAGRMLGVSPNRIVQDGEPPFKTQKQLGGRAIAADTFHRALQRGINGNGKWWPGIGKYAHREGYNVLYGDWHAEWYGDEEQVFLWWPGHPQGELGFPGLYATGQNNIINDFEPVGGGTLVQNHGIVEMWHMFDVSSGVDVGVDGL